MDKKMYQTSVNQKNKLNPYLSNQILQASPEQLFIKIYDYAIVHAEKKDMIKTNNAVQELISLLNFQDESYRELSTNLLGLYQYCQEQSRKQNFDIVKNILSQLRESWLSVINPK
jgi:flagellar secretion chaperone FliS